jgi:hypothetical protein
MSRAFAPAGYLPALTPDWAEPAPATASKAAAMAVMAGM